MGRTVHVGADRTRARALDRIGVYGRLAKIGIFDHYLGIVLCWSMLPRELAGDGRTAALLGLSLVATAACVWSAVALDDLQGFRDGTDAVNYDVAGREHRTVANKPLLDGRLAERDVVRFVIVCAVAGVAAVVAVGVITEGRPAWLLPVAIAIGVAGAQYSAGLKLSYCGGQEALLSVTAAAVVFLPFVVVSSRFTAQVAVEAALFGLWMLQISAFSNTHDIVGDRRSGRSTVATRSSPAANRRFIVAVFASGTLLLATAVAAGWASGWLLVAAAPVAALHGRQLAIGFARGGALRARRIGFLALRLGVAGFAVVNLLTRR